MMHRTDPRIATDTPACPVCHGLVCVCRPRFFSGQLLTDAELTAQQEWVINKNRLRNLHLHGAGVVCGLKVSCHPSCAGWVRISEGYAIGPCGDDIVVCETDDLDLVGAIEDRLREQARRIDPDCSPRRGGTRDCTSDGEWCISIRYEEWADRPVRPLRNGHEGSCPAGCSCGSGTRGVVCSSCGDSGRTSTGRRCAACGPTAPRTPRACTCGSSRSGSCECAPHPTVAPRGRPECEPTRWCEGYRLCVAPKAPERESTFADAIEGSLLGAVFECWVAISEAQSLVGRYRTPFQSCQALEQLKSKLLVLVEQMGVANCALVDEIHAIGCDPPSPEVGSIDVDAVGDSSPEGAQAMAYVEDVQKKTTGLQQVSFRLLLFCLCENLLPPCPAPPTSEDLCLACVTVRDGRVVDICNVGCRQHAITWPAVRWWASILPIEPLVQTLVEQLCCGELGRDVVGTRLGAIANPAMAQMVQQWVGSESPTSLFGKVKGGGR